MTSEWSAAGRLKRSTFFLLAYRLWDNGKLYLTLAEQNTYYFSVYDLENGESKRLAATEIIPENAVLIGDTIYYTGTTESRRGMREFIGDTDFEYDGTLLYSYILGADKAVRGGYAFYVNGLTGKLERINCSTFDKRNEIIRFLSPEYAFNKPFSIGYMTD